MRISDWSSDVCSSDLKKVQPLPLFAAAGIEDRGAEPAVSLPQMDLSEHVVEDYRALRFSLKAHPLSFLRQSLAREGIVEAMQLEVLKPGILRSEEHTSELQSLMRISYAVICLQKKKRQQQVPKNS